MVGDFRGDVLERAHAVGRIVGDRFALVVDEVACVTKIYYFDVEFGIQQHVLRFNVAVGDPATVDVP